jgi:hypothetical protein
MRTYTQLESNSLNVYWSGNISRTEAVKRNETAILCSVNLPHKSCRFLMDRNLQNFTLCVDFLTCFSYYRKELGYEAPLHARTHAGAHTRKATIIHQVALTVLLFCHQKAVWASLPHSDPYRSNSRILVQLNFSWDGNTGPSVSCAKLRHVTY